MRPIFWTQRVHFGPAPRLDHAMAYDAARQRVVLFGGIDARGTFGDTWLWDGAYWTQVANTGPQARRNHALAYDSTRQYVVLFGGTAGGATRLEDTWIWDGLNWTQVAESGPVARRAHAMASDNARGLIVLFGGEARDRELSDTWEWDGSEWTQREESGPPARYDHAMAYNPASASVVLFGGRSRAEVLDDTWEWDGTVWRQVSQFGPPGLKETAMSEDGIGSTVFGGVGATAGEVGHDETWQWDGRYWTEIQHFGPPGRAGHATVFDTTRRRVVLYGGNRVSGPPTPESLLGDTWECPAREPTLISVTVAPAAVRPGGTLVVTIRLSGTTFNDLPVQLVSSSGGQAVSVGLPSNITVANGHVEVSAILALSLGIADGTYTITAVADGINRSTSLSVSQAAVSSLRIVAALPEPLGDDTQKEAIHLKNEGATPIILAGWRLSDDQGLEWLLNDADGILPAGQVGIVTRHGRPMSLPGAGGTIVLIDPAGERIEVRVYGPVIGGQLVEFN